MEAVLKEVGIIGEESKTYTRSQVRKCEVNKINTKEKDFPMMCFIPKTHKNSSLLHPNYVLVNNFQN